MLAGAHGLRFHIRMHKYLSVYSIAKEKTRLAFGAAICEIDDDSFDVIDDHAIAFKSDRSLPDLHKILISSCIEPGDEAWIFILDKNFTGNGIALDDLRVFMSK